VHGIPREALGRQPVAHRHAVQGEERRVARRQRHRHREGPAAVGATEPLEPVHAVLEALPLGARGGARASEGYEAVVPGPIAPEALVRREAEVTLRVARRGRVRVALQHAEVGEEQPHCARFARGQREVVRAPRERAHRVLAPPGVPARHGLELDEFEVVEARAPQPPAGREAGDAAADDHDRPPPRLGRARQGTVAQPVAELVPRREQLSRRVRRRARPAACRSDHRRRAGGHELAALHASSLIRLAPASTPARSTARAPGC
jgi:hypothetical protein